MDLFGTSQQASTSALTQLSQLLSTLQRRPQNNETQVQQVSMPQAQAPRQASPGGSYLANLAGNYLMGPSQQLPWQAADPSRPGPQLPWQQPFPAWDMNNTVGKNLGTQALAMLGSLF